jgi:hypothetical protein
MRASYIAQLPTLVRTKRQKCAEFPPSREIHEAAIRQIAAQSRSRRMHSAIIATSSSRRHALEQESPVSAQMLQPRCTIDTVMDP